MPRTHSPTPEKITATRHALGLTRTEAGRLISSNYKNWQRYETGTRKMPVSTWKFFLLKTSTRARRLIAGRPNPADHLPRDKRETTRPEPVAPVVSAHAVIQAARHSAQSEGSD